MPRLLQIDSCLGVGSTGRIAEGIATAAMAKGWDCYMVHGARYVGESKQHSIQASTVLSERLHFLLGLVFDNHGLNSYLSTKRLIKVINRINPDLIQLHCIHGYYLNYKVLFDYLRNKRIPIVWTFHDCWAFTGHCSHFASIECNKWKKECFDCPIKHHYPKSLLLERSRKNYMQKKQIFNSVDNLTIVCVSHWLSSIVSESFFKERSRKVIYNGVDRSVFHNRDNALRAQYGLENRFVMIAVASSWGPGKGWNDYIKLASKLDDSYCLMMVGVTDSQKRELPPQIMTFTRTDNAIQLAELYSMADVVLNLSYYETFGMTSIEGQACGTPSIVYNCTASPELVTDKTGIVVEKGNVESVFTAIKTIRMNGKQYYSQECINRVKFFFDDRNQYDEYVELYNKLVK